MGKVDRSVVRNQAYRRGEFSIRERHNERKNMDYHNPDVITDRAHLNVHLKSCRGTYEQEFNRMVEDGTISLRGLKADAKVFDEMVFDVNTDYFDRNGGYEYAKDFFAEAYKLAVKEAGGEEYILSAVMHADERNKALSEQLGRDAFHYHLHVVYTPVVDKQILWSKRCKDPTLVGTVKETIKQVSHSKKWPRFKDDNGHWVNSYSLLQDRFHQHIKDAGFIGFERGERGSTAEHLSVIEYKTQKEAERAAALTADIGEKAKKSTELDVAVKNKQEQLSGLDKKVMVAKKVATTADEIDRIADKRTLLGDIPVSLNNWKIVSDLAKEGLQSRNIIKSLKETNTALQSEVAKQKSKLKDYGEGHGITAAMRFYQAEQRAPHRMAETLADIMRQPPEQQKPTCTKERSQGLSR